MRRTGPSALLPSPLLWALVGGVALLGCRDSLPEPRVVRLGSLIEMEGSSPLLLLAEHRLRDDSPFYLDAGVDASRYDALELRARGAATLLGVEWRLQVDRRFQPYRRLDVSLLAEEDSMRTYRIDLGREAYWTGEVTSLALTPHGGDLEVESLEALPAADLYRDAALRGVAAPALPGVRRLEIPLPRERPARARFETMVGLLPQYDRPGVRVSFRAYLEGNATEPWVDETVIGSEGEAGAWRPVRRSVDLPPGDEARLVLEVEAPAELAGGAMWGNPLLSWGTAPATDPNLLVILVDTLRRDVVGAYGDTSGVTPRLDQLAARSLRLDHLFAPASWTLPSVASLMTGLQPQTHGAGKTVEGFAPTGLTDSPHTLAEVLAAAGFYTEGIYSNIYLNTAFGLQQGFDRYTILEERAEVLVDAALESLAAAADRRFFLFLHLFDPHNPYEPPPHECTTVAHRLLPDYDGKLGCEVDRRPDLPLPPKTDRPWIEALYRAEVAYTDSHVGRLLDGLAELGLAERTIVAVLSDHGEEFWHRQAQEEAYGYRVDGDHGHTLYGELVEVPGILHLPGRDPAVLRSAVDMVDLYPTLLSLLGVAAPPSQGRDLSSALGGPSPTSPVLLFDFLLYGRARWAIQRGSHKLVVPHDGNGPIELFDLRADPRESQNLAANEPELVHELRRLGERELRAREGARSRFLDGESLGATYLEWRHVTRLRALGYLK